MAYGVGDAKVGAQPQRGAFWDRLRGGEQVPSTARQPTLCPAPPATVSVWGVSCPTLSHARPDRRGFLAGCGG